VDQLEHEAQPQITVAVATDGATTTVTIGGELDLSTVDELDAKTAPALAARPEHLIVDVGALRFADSSAIALWVRWSQIAGRFELRHPPEFLLRVLEAMGLADQLGTKR
jgi:anti-anti-sigma factor